MNAPRGKAGRLRLLVAALAVGCAVACFAYDARAQAADAKRVALLTLALVGLAAGLAFPRSRERSLAVRGSRVSWAALAGVAFVGWSALSVLWGQTGPALLELTPWCAALGIALAGAALGTQAAQRSAELAAWLVGILGSAWLIGAWLAGERGFFLHAGQGNPNWAGLLLAIAWPLARPSRAKWRAARWATRAVAAAWGLALVLCGSRVGLCAAGIGLVVAAWTAQAPLRAHYLTCLSMLALAFALTLAFAGKTSTRNESAANASANERGPHELPAPRSEGKQSAASSLAGRLWIQQISARAALANAPWGAGLGHFSSAFLSSQGRALDALSPQQAARRFSNATTAHNDWLQVALESGLPGLGLFCAALGFSLRAQLRSGWAAGSGSLAAFALASFGDSPLYLPAPTLLLGLVFGALPREGHALTVSPTTGLGLRVLLLAACASLLPPSLAAWLATRARSAASLAAPAQRARLLEKSARLTPGAWESAFELGLLRLESGHAEAAARELERAASLGAGLAALLALGNAEIECGKPERAITAFRAALALNRGSARAHLGLSEALREGSALGEAEEHARTALRLLPGDTRARELLDAIIEQRADHDLGL